MADLADAKAKLKEAREAIAKVRDDLHAIGLDLPDDLGAEVKAALQGAIKTASAGTHTVVMGLAELEEGLGAL